MIFISILVVKCNRLRYTQYRYKYKMEEIMIVNFEQKERLPLSKHEITRKGELIGTTVLPEAWIGTMQLLGHDYELNAEGFEKVVIRKDGMPYAECMSRLHVTKQILFVKTGWEYYELITPEKTYQIYETGLGADKHFYSFYEHDQVVAIIHKSRRSKAFLDTYTFYMKEEQHLEAVSLYCLFLESTQYYDMDATGNESSATETITMQKELKEKYDPTFIEQVIAMDKE